VLVGPIFVAALPRHYRQGASFRVSLHHGVLLSIRPKMTRLTQSPFLCLLYRKGDGIEHFNEDLNYGLDHRRVQVDLCIDIKMPEERFE